MRTTAHPELVEKLNKTLELLGQRQDKGLRSRDEFYEKPIERVVARIEAASSVIIELGPGESLP